MAMILRYRYWRRARRRLANYGPTCATTGRSKGRRHQRRCSSTRPIVAASIPKPSAKLRGILQADAYAGFNKLYDGARRPGPITGTACWAHGRRKFFKLADPALRKRSLLSPVALEAVKRIDTIFAIEREINGQPAEARLAARQQRIVPLIHELEAWMRLERARLSPHADVAKAFDYMRTRWPAFTVFLSDGRICLTNNAVERALRVIALGRKA